MYSTPFGGGSGLDQPAATSLIPSDSTGQERHRGLSPEVLDQLTSSWHWLGEATAQSTPGCQVHWQMRLVRLQGLLLSIKRHSDPAAQDGDHAHLSQLVAHFQSCANAMAELQRLPPRIVEPLLQRQRDLESSAEPLWRRLAAGSAQDRQLTHAFHHTSRDASTAATVDALHQSLEAMAQAVNGLRRLVETRQGMASHRNLHALDVDPAAIAGDEGHQAPADRPITRTDPGPTPPRMGRDPLAPSPVPPLGASAAAVSNTDGLLGTPVTLATRGRDGVGAGSTEPPGTIISLADPSAHAARPPIAGAPAATTAKASRSDRPPWTQRLQSGLSALATLRDQIQRAGEPLRSHVRFRMTLLQQCAAEGRQLLDAPVRYGRPRRAVERLVDQLDQSVRALDTLLAQDGPAVRQLLRCESHLVPEMTRELNVLKDRCDAESHRRFACRFHVAVDTLSRSGVITTCHQQLVALMALRIDMTERRAAGGNARTTPPGPPSAAEASCNP